MWRAIFKIRNTYSNSCDCEAIRLFECSALKFLLEKWKCIKDCGYFSFSKISIINQVFVILKCLRERVNKRTFVYFNDESLHQVFIISETKIETSKECRYQIGIIVFYKKKATDDLSA